MQQKIEKPGSAAHTPGPWTTQATEHGITVYSTAGRDVADVLSDGGSEAIADARLIAAAPELLEALRRAEAAIKYAVAAANSEADYVRICEIQDAVSAAIAKATGGAA